MVAILYKNIDRSFNINIYKQNEAILLALFSIRKDIIKSL